MGFFWNDFFSNIKGCSMLWIDVKINTDIVQFVVTAAAAAAGNLNGNMYEVRKMRELRQPTL